MMKRGLPLALALLTGLTACSTAPMNQPLARLAPAAEDDWISSGGYR